MLPPLAGEDHECAECGFAYRAVPPGDAATLLPRHVDELGAFASAASSGAGWTVSEYLCHIRDVLVVHTIRLHRARKEDDPALEPMYNDLRAARFDYRNADPALVITEIDAALRGFLTEVDRTHDWDRTAIPPLATVHRIEVIAHEVRLPFRAVRCPRTLS
jgi:hypothetical protein